MPIPLFRLRVRRQRTLPALVQQLPTQTEKYYLSTTGGPSPGWNDRKTVQQPTKRIGDQVTDSEEHPGWRQRIQDAKSLADIGGDFFSQKHYAYGIPSHVRVLTPERQVSGSTWAYQVIDGPVWSIDARIPAFPPSKHSTDAELDALGATAVARCKPTNSVANVAVALGELVREGIPKLAVSTWKGRAHGLKVQKEQQAAAGNYLAYQFGLAPLGQEIGTFAAAVVQADRLLAQYERDAGRPVRRRYEFPTKTENELYTIDAGYPVYMGIPATGALNSSLTTSQHNEVKVLRSTVQKRWFSGAFTYHMPIGYDARNGMDRKAFLAKEILGFDLFDIETIWNLTPWSWAIDWFSNAGDVISNLSSYAEDGLVMRYGYMMEHTIVKDTWTRSYPNTLRGGKPIDSYVTMVTETKIRRRANPFGFGLTMEGLNPFQWSILAALGISRKP